MTSFGGINHLKKAGKLTSTFYFKQFKVEDGRSTMKVCTDAVLLGAIVEVEHISNILEVGTGSGVIALIMAQRSEALIDAIEIDAESVDQAMENARNSPWQKRIRIIHQSIQDYTQQTGKKYDLVISNPPYFSRSLKSHIEKRNISRHNDILSFEELINCSIQLMSADASLWVILPMKECVEFLEIAERSGLFIHLKLNVFYKSGKKCQRIILQFTKNAPLEINSRDLTIKNGDNTFTPGYKELTKELYIDF